MNGRPRYAPQAHKADTIRDDVMALIGLLLFAVVFIGLCSVDWPAS